MIVSLTALAVSVAGFVFASESARSAVGNAVIPVSFAGLPLFEGFRHAGLFGVHVQWGLSVCLATFAIGAVVLALNSPRRSRYRDHSRA
ncbi:transcriptional regulator [Microbacterium testaceum]|uniref:transcriptional regulator n=1 Tax=Microbacterium testaceum TaxID=2033 RepID=UPI003802528C